MKKETISFYMILHFAIVAKLALSLFPRLFINPIRLISLIVFIIAFKAFLIAIIIAIIAIIA